MRTWPLFALLVACHEPRMPRAQGPYSLHLLGAGDGFLRGHLDTAGISFTGRPARDYAIQIANDSPTDVGVSLLVDGLDADTGEPATSCAQRCAWYAPASEVRVARGFSVDNESIATYRFTPREQALAMLTKGARHEAIGTIEACFFSLRPTPPDVPEPPAERFRGRIEREPAAGAVVSEVKPRAAARTYGTMTCDRLLDRRVIRYQAEDGSPLGTAPPPAGIARVVRPPPPRVPADVPEPPAPEPSKVVKPPKRQKPPK